MHYTEIRENVKRYRLSGDLIARMNIIVKGGVHRNMVYKAMKKGPVTPLASIILDEAETLIRQHMENVSDKLFQMELETAT